MKNNYNLLPVLNEIHRKVNSENEIKKCLQIIVEKLPELINFDRGGILISRENDEKLFYRISFPEGSHSFSQIENERINSIVQNRKVLFPTNAINEFVDNATETPLLLDAFVKEKISLIGLPLELDGTGIHGGLFLISKEQNAFSQMDFNILENIGEIIRSSILRVQNCNNAIDDLKKFGKDLRVMLHGNDKVSDKLMTYATELTNADQACLFRYDPEKKVLRCNHCETLGINHSAPNNACTVKLHSEKNIISGAFNTKRGIICHDVLSPDSRITLPSKIYGPIQSQMAVPLLGEYQQPFGVLALFSHQKFNFTKSQLTLLTAVTEIGITGLQNSKIVGKLEKLSDASNVLLSEGNQKTLDERFDSLVEKTTEILDAELCSLFLVENNELILKTSYSVENNSKLKKRKKEKVILPIISGERTGITGAIATRKKVYNSFGKKHQDHPAIKNPDENDFLPSGFCHSELAHPILDDNDELIGLLIAYNKRDETGQPLKNSGFSWKFDVPFMKILTTKLKICIKNAQLISKLKHYELIIENTPDSVIITDREGKIIYLNTGAKELFGEIIGLNVRNHFFTDNSSTGYQKAIAIARKLLKNRDKCIKGVETVFTGKDGRAIPISLSVSLIKDEYDKFTGAIGISKDLTEIKTLQNLGQSLLSTPNIDLILQKISDVCSKLPKCNRAYIKLYDETTEKMAFQALSSQNPKDKLPESPTSKDRGMTGHVFRTQKPYLTGDVDQEPRERFHRIFADVKSKICVPINITDKTSGCTKTLGVITIDSKEKNAFSFDDVFFLFTIANQAAAAIENAKLFEAKTKIITELLALEKVQETITRTLDVDSILESVLDVVVDTLGFHYATISRVSKSRGKIGAVKGRNVSDNFLDSAWHPLDSNDIQAWVVRNKEEVLLDTWDERLDPEIYRRYHHHELTRIFLPIFSRNEAYGTLETGYKKSQQPSIPAEEIEILRKIVNLAGIGIDQSYLLNEQQKLVQQLRALNQAGIYFQASRSDKEVVQHIFKSLEKIGYSQGMLSLINENKGIIEGRFAFGNNWLEIIDDTKRDLKGNDILALAIRQKVSILSKDCYHDPRCDQSAAVRGNIKSQYVIPLIANETAIGTLQIDLSDKQGLIKAPENILKQRLNVLETFASQIAIALRNVKDREIINLLETTLMETAHEFRSPLHNILAQIGSLRSQLPKNFEINEDINTIFKIISEEAHRASKQMENTLIFSKKTMGAMGYNFEEGNIQDLIQQCANNYRLRALERGISIIIKDNVKKLPSFKFDKTKIEQVINNLIDNAVKYSHFNRFIQIQGFDDGTQIHVDFWDKGLGIPDNEYDNIFEGFTRGNVKDKTRYIPGTGLGLKISKEIIHGHGGEIKVKSNPFYNDPRKIHDYDGYDTIFTVILPKKPKER